MTEDLTNELAGRRSKRVTRRQGGRLDGQANCKTGNSTGLTLVRYVHIDALACAAHFDTTPTGYDEAPIGS